MNQSEWIDAHATGHVLVDGQDVPVVSANTVVVGTGAAGFCAADRLVMLGQRDVVMVTDKRRAGASRNAGSDKQTYYKLTLSGAEPDDTDGKLSSRVNELVMKINGDYGSLGFTPVHHYPQYLRQDEYFALLRAADIGLITSVRDGMNTTSLEYVVCQKQGHGPLILSEFSGTAGSLADAIHINPWDLSGVASEINTALTMPEDQRRVMQERLYHHVTTHNVQSWIDKFIRRVYTVLGEAGSAHATPLLDRALLLSQYRSAGKRLFMFDYDGTLTPIVREPSAAIPSERIIAALKLLAADERNAVWIISGRDQEFLGHHLGHISRLGFSAEHGSFMRNPGSQEWVNLAEKFDMGWQAEVMEVFQKYTDKVQGE